MKLTWLVLGVVLAAGAVAFINTEDEPVALPKAEAGSEDGGGRKALSREANLAPAAPREADVKLEKHARALLDAIARAGAEGDGRTTATLEARLRKEAWDAPSARRYAYRLGRNLLDDTGEARGRALFERKDKARRLLSRVLFLPEMFGRGGASTSERSKIIDEIQMLNRQVMLYRPGLPGVTVPYDIPQGIRPVEIVSRKKLPMGSNAILFWNQGGNLNPKSLRAGSTFLLPQEPLSLHVNQRFHRLAVYIGDWFVKEFRVGIGKDQTPTPTGTFVVHSREKNPDWWKPGGKRIPFGDPRNELGSAWIAIQGDEWPLSAGYGIHGTNDERTVGTRCSNGCVRLVNGHVTELYDWVRTGSAGGTATRIYIE